MRKIRKKRKENGRQKEIGIGVDTKSRSEGIRDGVKRKRKGRAMKKDVLKESGNKCGYEREEG